MPQHNRNSLVIYSPFTGNLHPIADTPDNVFSQKVTGDGFCVFPTDGTVLAPADGTVNFVFDAKHALVMTDTEGVEYLLHIGIDTVTLGGAGFTAYVKAEETVKQGDILLSFSPDAIEAAGLSPACVCVFTDLTDDVGVEEFTPRAVRAAEKAVCLIYRKETAE